MGKPLRAAVEHALAADDGSDAGRWRELLDRPEPWSRGAPLHVTASALVVHPGSRRVLLRWHERMQRWMQVGGHADAGEHDPWDVARREAQEETGLHDLHALSPAHERRPVQLEIVPVPAHGTEPAHEHADIRYLLATAHPDAARPEVPTAPLRWLPIDDALTAVEEPNVRTLLERAREALF